MKTKSGFCIREVCGEKIIVAEGKENIDFSNIISMNESAAYLWNSIEGKNFTIETLTNLLLKEYDVDEAIAKADALSLVAQWNKAEIIEGDDIPDFSSDFYQSKDSEAAIPTTDPNKNKAIRSSNNTSAENIQTTSSSNNSAKRGGIFHKLFKKKE